MPVDDVITVIADGSQPATPAASEHNARQRTFWHRAGTVCAALHLDPDKNLLN